MSMISLKSRVTVSSLSNVNRQRDIKRVVRMVLLFAVLIRLTLEKTRSTEQDVIGSVIRAWKHGYSGKRPHCICPSLQEYFWDVVLFFFLFMSCTNTASSDSDMVIWKRFPVSLREFALVAKVVSFISRMGTSGLLQMPWAHRCHCGIGCSVH